MNAKKVCCFSGHRPKYLPWRQYEVGETFFAFKKRLEKTIENVIEAGYNHFISGMAQGIDMLAAEIVLLLKEKYSHITLECAIPFSGQKDSFNSSDRVRYNNICKQADLVSVLTENYSPDCLMKRNKYMVDKSSKLIACYLYIKGGTYNTIRYAMQKGVDVEIVKILEEENH